MLVVSDKGSYSKAVCVLLCVLLVLSGCVQATVPTAEPQTVTFACPARDRAYYEELAEAFSKEYRGIKVELSEPIAYSLPRQDVFSVGPFVRRFIRQGDFEVLDLRPFVEHDDAFQRADFIPHLLDIFTDDEGVLWAVPYAVDMSVMYYNRDLFDRYHVPQPRADWTWDDFLAAAKRLYLPAERIFGYIPDEDFGDALAVVYQNGGRIFDDWQNPTRTTFDDPLTVEALEWYGKLMHDEKAAATPTQARQTFGIVDYVAIAWREGHLGMWPGPVAARGGRLEREPWPFAWGVVPLPRGKYSATFANVEGYAISAQAGYPEACWKWVSFLTRQIPLHGVPVRKSLIESKALDAQLGKDVAAVARASIDHALFFSPAGWDVYGTLQIFREALEKIASGSTTAYEAMIWAQQRSQYK